MAAGNRRLNTEARSGQSQGQVIRQGCNFIDTHTHLTLPEFQDDLEAVIERAQIAGVEKMIVPAIDLNSSMQALALAEKYAAVFAAVGVHPQDVQTFENAQLEEFHQLAQHPKVVAIGEIGLDYYRRFARNCLILKYYLIMKIQL